MCSTDVCSKQVLVVDDDELIRLAVAEAVEAMGLGVLQARDGVEALEHLARGARPCLTIVDLMMPRMGGEEFARTVRDEGLGLAIVSMSAGDRHLEPPLVAAHLRKPFALHHLEDLVDRHCGGSGRRAPDGEVTHLVLLDDGAGVARLACGAPLSTASCAVRPRSAAPVTCPECRSCVTVSPSRASRWSTPTPTPTRA